MRVAPSLLLALGAWLAALAVALGAFAAHALTASVGEQRLDTFETAARYHLVHALAVVLSGILAGRPHASKAFGLAGVLFITGIALFAGSLYALVLLDMPALGMITPLGGVSFIAGWIVLGIASLRRPEDD